MFKDLDRFLYDFNGIPSTRFDLCHDDADAEEDGVRFKSFFVQGLILCKKIKETICNNGDQFLFLKLLHVYSNNVISRSGLQKLFTDLLPKDSDLREELDGYLDLLAGLKIKSSVRKSDGDLSDSRKHKKQKLVVKSVADLDLSKCKTLTPSYRLLPEEYQEPSQGEKSDLGNQVLNQCCVSVGSNISRGTSRPKLRGKYEELLFQCEDDRFEIDLLCESVKSAVNHVEKMLIEGNYRMEIPVVLKRCIERLYGDHGLEILGILRENPDSSVLILILNRLKQKQRELTMLRAEFDDVCAQVYADKPIT